MHKDTKNLIAKINRRCTKHGNERRLCTTPDRFGFTPLGDHYVIDTDSHGVIRTHVDVEALATDLGIDTRSRECKAVDDAQTYARVFAATWPRYLATLDARLDVLAA